MNNKVKTTLVVTFAGVIVTHAGDRVTFAGTHVTFTGCVCDVYRAFVTLAGNKGQAK